MFDVYFPEQELLAIVDRAAAKLEAVIPELAHAAGVYLMGKVQIDYKIKARGGTGADGTSWKPNAPSTIAAKLRRAQGRGGKRTKGRKRKRPLTGSVEIGVDTGLQLSSATPGFVGSDGKGGNVFGVEGSVLLIGFGRSYSEYFDAVRPLMPETLPQSWADGMDRLVEREMGFVTRGLFEG